MKITRLYLFRFPVILAVILGLSLSASLPTPALADCIPAWNVVASPNGSGDDNALADVTVISANDVWAVGHTGSGLNPLNTLAMHWDGSAWSVVPTPNGSFSVNYLTSVSAISSSNVWAVGFTFNGSTSNPRSSTLILHWDGSAWTTITSPNTNRNQNRLNGVVAISANDVWAVGNSDTFSIFRSLTMHWDGISWTIVTSPNPGSSANFLYGVDAIASNDVWAVGTQQNSLEQTLALHWNGSSWAVVATPQIGPYGNNMLDVSAISATDIWAAGFHLSVFGVSQVYQTSAFHYNGTSWSAVPPQNVNQLNNYLFDVAGLAANDAWAVGFFDTGTTLEAMNQHWDGTSWTIVDSPHVGDYFNELISVAAVSANEIWAVGEETDGLIGVNTLTIRYNNTCPTTIHVSSITPSFQPRSGRFQVRAAVTILDSSGLAVSDASVTVQATLPDNRVVTRTAATNASGQANVSVNSTLTGTYTFTVANISKTGFTYDAGQNLETTDSILVQ